MSTRTIPRPGFRTSPQRLIHKRDLLLHIETLYREARAFQVAVASETFLQLLGRTIRNQYGAIRQRLARSPK